MAAAEAEPSQRGHTLSWLTLEQRLLTLELAMTGAVWVDPSSRDAAPAGFRSQGTDRLALGGAPRHPEGHGQEKDAAPTAAHSYPGAVVEVGPRPSPEWCFRGCCAVVPLQFHGSK